MNDIWLTGYANRKNPDPSTFGDALARARSIHMHHIGEQLVKGIQVLEEPGMVAMTELNRKTSTDHIGRDSRVWACQNSINDRHISSFSKLQP